MSYALTLHYENSSYVSWQPITYMRAHNSLRGALRVFSVFPVLPRSRWGRSHSRLPVPTRGGPSGCEGHYISVSAPKNFGFSVLVSVVVCGFSFLSIWFLVYGQNTSGFSDLVSDVVFDFSYLVSGFSSAIMRLNRVRVPRLCCQGSSRIVF